MMNTSDRSNTLQHERLDPSQRIWPSLEVEIGVLLATPTVGGLRPVDVIVLAHLAVLVDKIVKA
jgi:hypothetical protein